MQNTYSCHSERSEESKCFNCSLFLDSSLHSASLRSFRMTKMRNFSNKSKYSLTDHTDEHRYMIKINCDVLIIKIENSLLSV